MATVKYSPIGYQVVDKEAGDIHPDMDASFCIYSKPQALAMIHSTKNLVDRHFELVPIEEGDIEDPTFMFDGDPESSMMAEIYKEALEKYTDTLSNLNDEDVDTVFLNAVKQMETSLEILENSHNQVDDTKYNVGEYVSNMRFYLNNILRHTRNL